MDESERRASRVRSHVGDDCQVVPAEDSSRGFVFYVSALGEEQPSSVVKLPKTSADEPDAAELYRTALPTPAEAVRNLATEATVLRRLEVIDGVPVPTVVDADIDAGDQSYLRPAYVDGPTLDALPDDQQPPVVEQLGHAMAVAHDTFSFNRFGDLDASDGDLIVESGDGTWQERVDAEVADGLTRLDEGPLSDLAPAAARWYDDARAALSREFDATLVHEDLTPLNVIVDDSRDTPAIGAIVDWEDITAAPAELQVDAAVTKLSRQLRSHPESAILDRFVAGYQTERTRADGYADREPVYAFRRWLHTFGNLRPGLDTSEGRAASVEQHAREAFERITGVAADRGRQNDTTLGQGNR